MKIITTCVLAIVLFSCGNTSVKPTSIEIVSRVGQQDSLFKGLMTASSNAVPDSIRNDSLAFMVVPVQASCPSCRNKTIDSIIKHQDDLAKNHFIIITAKGGRKTMNSYFKEQDAEMPDMDGQLILDSINRAYKLDLFKDNPAIYYSANSKVYKKVLARPATVKQDLQEFFSGWRSEETINKDEI